MTMNGLCELCILGLVQNRFVWNLKNPSWERVDYLCNNGYSLLCIDNHNIDRTGCNNGQTENESGPNDGNQSRGLCPCINSGSKTGRTAGSDSAMVERSQFNRRVVVRRQVQRRNDGQAWIQRLAICDISRGSWNGRGFQAGPHVANDDRRNERPSKMAGQRNSVRIGDGTIRLSWTNRKTTCCGPVKFGGNGNAKPAGATGGRNHSRENARKIYRSETWDVQGRFGTCPRTSKNVDDSRNRERFGLFGSDGVQVPERNRDSLNRPVQTTNFKLQRLLDEIFQKFSFIDLTCQLIGSETGLKSPVMRLYAIKCTIYLTTTENVTTRTLDVLKRKRVI